MSMSVLQNAKRSDVVATPFPHLLIENALPDALYRADCPAELALGQFNSSQLHHRFSTVRRARCGR